MNDLFIYCAGGFGKEVIDIARRLNKKNKSWHSIFFIDDFCTTESRYGASVYSFSKAKHCLSINTAEIVIAIGEPAQRSEIRTRIENHGLKLVSNLIDDSAIISASSFIDSGVVVSPLCSISSNSFLDKNCSVNTMSIIGHDVNIGENSVISSMVNLGGNVRVGKNSYIGMGSLIKEGVNIGDNVIIGMGSVVYNDIPSDLIALGNPARAIRPNVDGKIFR